MLSTQVLPFPSVPRKRAAYLRAFARIAEMRAQGKTTATIGLADLEALLAIVAHNDLGALA